MATREEMISHLRNLADALEKDPALAIRLVSAVPEGTAAFAYTGDVPMTAGYHLVAHLEVLKADLVTSIMGTLEGSEGDPPIVSGSEDGT